MIIIRNYSIDMSQSDKSCQYSQRKIKQWGQNLRKDKNPTCDLRDSRHPGRTCGPHGVRIREVPALPAVPALRCHIAPKMSALKCFKQNPKLRS